MNDARLPLHRQPLLRLLAVNLAAGIALAVLLFGGLIGLNVGGLRGLIAADHSPAAALGLLLFGFVVTFGSVAMGTAVMALRPGGESGGGGRRLRYDTDRESGAPALQRVASTRTPSPGPHA